MLFGGISRSTALAKSVPNHNRIHLIQHTEADPYVCKRTFLEWKKSKRLTFPYFFEKGYTILAHALPVVCGSSPNGVRWPPPSKPSSSCCNCELSDEQRGAP